LPKDILHPTIQEKTWPAFLRGELDTSIFQAFKEVEVAVRAAGGFDATDLGTDLMRKAFHSTNGPLVDTSEPPSEREALPNCLPAPLAALKIPPATGT
jgi:hypothetical protein